MLGIALVFAVLMTAVTYSHVSILNVVGETAGALVILSALYEPFTRWRAKQHISRAVLGMCVAHLGLGIFVLGVTTVKSNEIQQGSQSW